MAVQKKQKLLPLLSLVIVVLVHALPIAAANIDSLRLKAVRLMANGQYQRAAQVFLKAYSKKPHHLDLFNAASCFDRAHQYPEAVELLRRLLQSHADLHPKYRYYVQARILLQERYPDRAVTHFAMTREAGLQTPEIHYWNGKALLLSGRLKEAELAFLEAAKERPRYAEPVNGLGAVYLKSGRQAKALSAFRKAIRLDKGFAAPRNNLGYLLLKQGKPKQAVKQFTKACELDSEEPRCWSGLGAALLLVGERGRGVAALERATRMRPRLAEPHVWLSRHYHGFDPAKALHHAQMACQLGRKDMCRPAVEGSP